MLECTRDVTRRDLLSTRATSSRACLVGRDASGCPKCGAGCHARSALEQRAAAMVNADCRTADLLSRPQHVLVSNPRTRARTHDDASWADPSRNVASDGRAGPHIGHDLRTRGAGQCHESDDPRVSTAGRCRTNLGTSTWTEVTPSRNLCATCEGPGPVRPGRVNA